MAIDNVANGLGTDFQQNLNLLSSAGSELKNARTELEDTYKNGSSEELEIAKMKFEEQQQKFKLLQAVMDLIARMKNDIIQRMGQIGR